MCRFQKNKAKQENKPFFVWLNTTWMHFRVHPPDEIKGQSGRWQSEYHDAMIATLELVWGAGFMAPGGKGNVERMVRGLDVAGRQVLDVGCTRAVPPWCLQANLAPS